MIGLIAILLSAAPAFAPWEEPPTFEPSWLEGSDKHRVEAPKRIVTLAPSLTEILFAIGAGPRVVGVSRYDDFPPEVAKIPKAGGFLDPNVEAVIALRPDLVIAAPNAGNRPALERIAKLKVPVLVVPGNGFGDLFHGTRAIAKALGGDAPAKADAMLAGIEKEVVALRGSVQGRRSPRVAFVYDRAPLILAGPGSFADVLLGALDATNVVKTKVAYPSYALEQLIVDAPEVIIDAGAMSGAGAEAFWRRFPTIPAVKSGRVHTLTDTSLLRASPRIVTALRTIAPLIYPPDAQR